METTQAIDLNATRRLLQEHGLQDAANLITAGIEVIDVTCGLAGYVKAPAAGNTALMRQQDQRQPEHDHEVPSVADCNPNVRAMQELMKHNCGQVFDPCWSEMIAMSIGLFRSIPEVKDYIGRTKARLVPTGVTGAAVDGEGDATTLVANYPVTPAQSILLKMEDWPFPFPVACLSGIFAFSGGGGTLEENYQQVLLKAYVGPKSTAPTAGALGAPWNDNELSYGSELRCGDGCKSIFLKGQGCGPASVGMLSELRILVTNKATATANITRHQLHVTLGGLKKYCCDSCAVGSGSSCGGSCKT